MAKCPINDWYIKPGTLGPGGIRGRRYAKDYFIVAFPHRGKLTKYLKEHSCEILSDRTHNEIFDYVEFKRSFLKHFDPEVKHDEIYSPERIRDNSYWDHPFFKYTQDPNLQLEERLLIDAYCGSVSGGGDIWVVSLDRQDMIDYILANKPVHAEIRKMT